MLYVSIIILLKAVLGQQNKKIYIYLVSFLTLHRHMLICALPIDESVQYGNTTGSRPSNLTVVNSIFDDHR